jgi:hypothetical protein
MLYAQCAIPKRISDLFAFLPKDSGPPGIVVYNGNRRGQRIQFPERVGSKVFFSPIRRLRPILFHKGKLSPGICSLNRFSGAWLYSNNKMISSELAVIRPEQQKSTVTHFALNFCHSFFVGSLKKMEQMAANPPTSAFSHQCMMLLQPTIDFVSSA